MASLDDDFDELRERMKRGRNLANTGFEPVYYLIFNPARIMDVKRRTTAWAARLALDGFSVVTFSIADEILQLLKSDARRPIWIAADKRAPLNFRRTTSALTNALVSSGALQKRLEAVLDSMEATPHGLVLVTDLEALHPYLRIGSIEAQLQGRFRVPTIFLYPGIRAGSTRLKFLGFYTEDGNNRSDQVGG